MNMKEAIKLKDELKDLGYHAYALPENSGDGWLVKVIGKHDPYKQDVALAMERLAQL